VARELCPFDMVPTTSTIVQLIFGDLLAIALMRLKGFTLEDFRHNHPAGRLGKRLLLTVKDVMISGAGAPLISPAEVLINALPEFSGKKCGCLIVVDEEVKLLGIFTDGDLRRALQKHGAMVLHKTMKELMTPSARFIDPKMLAFDAMKQMEADQKRPITVLPVVDGGKVVGILRMHDIVQSGIS
ncbi:MAG TPA: CBS domain-containing protein, partial [Chlamydiales bacterium]|nr:CBS domain-containing protein [Chlamydiales bacterium]